MRNWSGQRWCNGIPAYTAFQTVLPPNGPSCSDGSGWDERNTIITPTSNHPGGVSGAMADGSVRFISQSIDAGNPTLTEVSAVGGRSPYGVWGSMGSGRGGETSQSAD